MKLKNILALASLVAFTVGCEDIKESERFIAVEIPETPETPDTPGVTQPKNVLVEDFTGMLCINCPDAVARISELQEFYGHDRVIAVAIHGDMPGLSGPLKNDLGTEYYKHWGVQSLPIGMVDRKGGLQNHTSWMALTSERLAVTSPVNLSLENTTYEAAERALTVQVDAQAEAGLNAKLQVWITESNIVAFQKQPDGSTNPRYVHNHVLRGAVNGSWGETIALEAGVEKQVTYHYTVPTAWVAENLSVVAFVYDGATNEVIQVIEQPLFQTEESENL